MKNLLIVWAFILSSFIATAQIDLGGKIRDKVNDRVNQKVDESIDKSLDEVENSAKKKNNKKQKKTTDENSENNSGNNNNSNNENTETQPTKTVKQSSGGSSLKAYNNYDFTAGEKIIFEDNFADAQDGEFPSHYNLVSGQGTVNTENGMKYFVVTEGSVGNIQRIEPLIKSKSYLGTAYTVEYDFYLPEDETSNVIFKEADGESGKFISLESNGEVKTNYFTNELKGNYPNNAYLHGAWHHLAMAYKSGQMKIYIDQHRVLVIPQMGFQAVSVMFGGSMNVRIKNIKIAEGGGMNMLNKIFTDGKFVTHGITFDVNKATIKPESMGVLTEIAKFMKANPTLKVSVEGHTDSDGDAAYNMTLSQQRADAVKKALSDLGVDGARMQIKGFGASRPIDNNGTPQGKANNRRVEFIKI